MCYVIYKKTEEDGDHPVCFLFDKSTATWFADLIETEDNVECAIVPLPYVEAVRQRITYFEKVLAQYAPE